jgi:hypothetical protein
MSGHTIASSAEKIEPCDDEREENLQRKSSPFCEKSIDLKCLRKTTENFKQRSFEKKLRFLLSFKCFVLRIVKGKR